MSKNQHRDRQQISTLEMGQVEVCRSLEPAVRSEIAQRASRACFAAGEEIVAQLDRSYDVYFMISGRVRVNIVATTGRQITYQILEPGQLFGELSAIDGKPRSAGVRAEDNVVLARIDAAAFLDLMTRHASFAFAIMQRLAALSRWLSEKVFEYHAYDVKGRLYSELLRLHQKSGSLELAVTDRDMASRVGTTRENVTRIYGELKQNGIVARRPSITEIIDLERLKNLLGECEFG